MASNKINNIWNSFHITYDCELSLLAYYFMQIENIPRKFSIRYLILF